MFPYFSLNANTQESNGNKYLISYFSVVIFVPFSAVIYYLSEEITVLLFSAKWIDASPVIQLLAISISAKIIHKINSALIKSSDRIYLRAKIQVVYCICTLLGSILMIKLGYGLKRWRFR